MMKIRITEQKRRLTGIALCMALSCGLLAGCVDQKGGSADTESTAEGTAQSAETLLEITDPEEKAAVEAAKAKVAAMEEEPRIIATSPATADICDRLELELVGVCSSTVSTIPERYAEVEQVGTVLPFDVQHDVQVILPHPDG